MPGPAPLKCALGPRPEKQRECPPLCGPQISCCQHSFSPGDRVPAPVGHKGLSRGAISRSGLFFRLTNLYGKPAVCQVLGTQQRRSQMRSLLPGGYLLVGEVRNRQPKKFINKVISDKAHQKVGSKIGWSVKTVSGGAVV